MKKVEKPAMVNNESLDISSVSGLFGFLDDNRPLPLIHLGDLFIKSPSSLVFAVISASCDLQFVPESVWRSRGVKKNEARIKLRDESVLLIPGTTREIDASPTSQIVTGLIRIKNGWYSIDWHRERVFSLPHSALRSILEDRGYEHSTRLQLDRAIELQQKCFAQLGRVGLAIQPPMQKEYQIRTFKWHEEAWVEFGKTSQIEAVAFHSSKKNVAVVKYDSLTRLRNSLQEDSNLASSLASLASIFVRLHKTPLVLPDKNKPGQLNLLIDREKKKVPKIGATLEEPNVKKKGIELMLMFVEKAGAINDE
ncbi:hypothetical protein [Mariniblastus fucicola]|uniref:Uncharacterized protein n=1 Tax=Mariniblastus fucicola TaxID=980251 RepID=A0A5B9PFR6_9BACT|nr:hypothetical protein [Mariniblastus fucicola]QEG25154.1 hypothetical protein MFFC18_50780 [Mariniblastus fucicola]